jgi:hypothetical protein
MMASFFGGFGGVSTHSGAIDLEYLWHGSIAATSLLFYTTDG